MIEVGNWLFYAFLSLIFYGIWGFISKLTTGYIDPKSGLFYESIGAIVTSLLLLGSQGFKIESNYQGVSYAMLVGVISTLATFFFFIALKYSKASIVVPLTALYPSVTVLLALFFLKEPINFKQILGIILATASVTLFSDN